MSKRALLKILLVVIIVLSVGWMLLMVMNLSSSRKCVEFPAIAVAVPEEERAADLTSMLIVDTVTNITVTQGDTLCVGYRLVNVGKDTLFIYDITPDCTCTDYFLSARKAAPQDTINLELVVETGHKYGKNLIHVVLESNNQEKMDMIKLPFIVETDPVEKVDSIMTKKSFRFRKMKIGDEKKIHSFVVNKSSKDIVLSLMTSCDCIHVNPGTLLVKAKSQSDYMIYAKPKSKGEYSEYVILRESAHGGMVTVEVTGIVE